MANLYAYQGFSVCGELEPNFSYSKMPITATANPIGLGSLVKANADGTVSVMAAANDAFLGVVTAVYNSSGGVLYGPQTPQYLPANTDGYVDVYGDPFGLYRTKFATNAAAPTGCGVGAQFDAYFNSPQVDTATGQSTTELSATRITAGQQGQFTFVRFDTELANTAGVAGASVIVTPNKHVLKAAVNAI